MGAERFGHPKLRIFNMGFGRLHCSRTPPMGRVFEQGSGVWGVLSDFGARLGDAPVDVCLGWLLSLSPRVQGWLDFYVWIAGKVIVSLISWILGSWVFLVCPIL